MHVLFCQHELIQNCSQKKKREICLMCSDSVMFSLPQVMKLAKCLYPDSHGRINFKDFCRSVLSMKGQNDILRKLHCLCVRINSFKDSSCVSLENTLWLSPLYSSLGNNLAQTTFLFPLTQSPTIIKMFFCYTTQLNNFSISLLLFKYILLFAIDAFMWGWYVIWTKPPHTIQI